MRYKIVSVLSNKINLDKWLAKTGYTKEVKDKYIADTAANERLRKYVADEEEFFIVNLDDESEFYPADGFFYSVNDFSFTSCDVEKRTFDNDWAEKAKAGYLYGQDALELVKMGWEMRDASR